MNWIIQVKSWLIVVVIVVECFSSGITNPSGSIIVQTRYGQILGKTTHFPEEGGDIKSVHTFLGVPFAAPPVDELRFQRPQSPAAWVPRVYDATFFRNVCPQTRFSHFENSILQVWPEFTWETGSSEDCLYLNIFTPGKNASNTSQLYPVIMFIHGGSYVLGTTARHTTPGEVLPRSGVVLVTIQYRLGPFGFMTTGDDVAPGNWGMLDQVEALKWIQENIEAFGGDPNKVTILGVSSGGACVGLHLLSPLSKGLFHRAISESGVEFSPFAFRSVEEAVLKTKRTAKKLECDTTSSQRMIDCLRTKDVQSIIDSFRWQNTGPVVDGHFIHDTPQNLRRLGKFYQVPLLSGFNSDEGAHNTPPEYRPPTEITPSVFRDFIKFFVEKQILHNNKNTAVLIEDGVEFQYTPWSKTPDSPTLRHKIVNIQSDYFVASPTVEVLGIHSAQAPAYMFEFNHRSAVRNMEAWRGVAHGENTPYVFGAPFLNITSLNFTDEDRNVSSLIMSLYANFAKYGNPTPRQVQGLNWEKFNMTDKLYLRINNRSEMEANYEPNRMAFWNTYYPRLLNFTKQIEQDKGPGTNPGNHNNGVERASNSGLLSLLLSAIVFLLAAVPS